MIKRFLDVMRRGNSIETKIVPPPVARSRIELPADISVIYVLPDIHGCIDELMAAERRIEKDAKTFSADRKMVVVLGDYVDRGPRSSTVLDRCIRGGIADIDTVFLCGNHDWSMLRFLENAETGPEWLVYGGDATLFSYGVDVAANVRAGGMKALQDAAKKAVPQAHIDFLSGLPVLARQLAMVFVHAGIRPGVDLDRQSEQDLMWIRDPFLEKGPGPEHLVVHGHTVFDAINFGPNRIGVDTGCYARGRLSVLRIAGGRASEV